MKNKKQNYIYKICQKYNVSIDDLIRDAIKIKRLGKVFDYAMRVSTEQLKKQKYW
jgi:hypothetical protein